MKSKRELRDLEKQKVKSSAKVGQFLLNLQTLKKQLEHEKTSILPGSKRTTPIHRQHLNKNEKSGKKLNAEADILITAPSSVERLSPITR